MAQAQPAEQMDAITMLETDHRTVEQLFTQLEEATDGDDKSRLAAEIITELTIHARVEEEIVYPAVRASLPDATELVDHSLEEHDEVKTNLTRLGELDPSSEDFEELWREIQSSVQDHVAEEESDMFPRFRQEMSSDQLADMGRQIMELKGQQGTTQAI